MKTSKILLPFLLLFISITSVAQLNGNFTRLNDGYVYFVLTNPTYNTYSVSWAATNDYQEQQRKGSMYIQPGQTVYFGPSTIGWFWEQGETFAWATPYDSKIYSYGNRSNPSFRGENSDGYIPDGDIVLTSVVSEYKKKFKKYTRRGSTYVKYGNNYIKVSGVRYVVIDNIKYWGID